VICDFCSSPAPAWRYPADSFLDQLRGRSVGDWLACDECHGLIESGDRPALAQRSLLTHVVRKDWWTGSSRASTRWSCTADSSCTAPGRRSLGRE
jgi:hypothetical protein